MPTELPVLARPPAPRRRLAVLAGLLAAVAVGLALASGGDPAAPLVVRVDGGPAALAVSGGRVWVAAPRAGAVAVIDAESGDPAMPPLRTGGAPARLAIGASGLWVADAAAGAVMGVTLRPPRVHPPIRVGADASDVVLTGGALWIASSADSRVYIVDDKGASALRVGRGPVALAADGRRVVVADSQAGTITTINARTRRPLGSPVSLGGAPVDVALAGDTAWVADSAGGRVAAVDLPSGTVIRSIAVGRRPVALATAGEDVYVLSAGERRLLRIRDGKIRSRRAVGADPVALAVDRRYIWVAAGSDEVLRFNR